ncbi:MAG TPA: outer membrane lipoprotein carrier protein LolA [Acidobacteriaceae bacterium]|nr:outer membrane lipoprotein carrier protein LolA [Acidobacteriaceae bacterium]
MKMLGVLVGIAMAAVAGAQAPAARTEAPSAKELAARVDAHYNHLHTLTAHFTERYRGMGIDRTETGTLTLSKPGRMRWEYDAPLGKIFVLDGKNAVSYTPGDSQALRTPAKQLDDLRSPLRFLLGHTEIAKELDGLTMTLVNGGYTLSGVPKGMQQTVQSIGITVDGAGQITGMRIVQTDGAETSFAFGDIRENVATPDSEFEFTPPPGVTIIDGVAPI